MAKLHIYMKVGNVWEKIAEGDGIVDQSRPFTVTLTDGVPSVSKERSYQVCQNRAAAGLLCDCRAVAGRTATFQASASPALAVEQVQTAQRAGATLNAALTAVSKSIVIQIADQDLVMLKSNAYALCFAKKVGSGEDAGSYTVVWRTFTDYLENTMFLWTPQYALFGSDIFLENYWVNAITNTQVIGLGEQCVLDARGVIEEPGAGGPATGVTMVNNYRPVHPGLSQMAMLAGVPQLTPLHIAPQPIALGTATLTPIEMVLVWFEQNVQTSTMFSSRPSMSVEVDLTSANSATRLYQNGQWVIP